jgi:aspartate ammonia-lyase
MRKESDLLGSMQLPEDVLFGIHSARAKENFPDTTSFPLEWYKAVGLVKKACYLTYQSFKKASLEKYQPGHIPFSFMDDAIITELIETAGEISQGDHFSHFIIPATSGGAGTSINMNVNEIIANVSLISIGRRPGDYSFIDPIEHANVFQSTNDVIPTSLKVATIFLLQDLEKKINELRFVIEQLENTHRDDLRIGYTQMQEAVPSSFGTLFSTYSEALSRDWWRVSKCFERIKMVNLGGGAIGTGLAIPRFYIMEVVQHLQKLTNLPVTRSENMPDVTSNLDSFVEVHATLKAHAVNLEKMVSDLRLLASDIGNRNSVLGTRLPEKEENKEPGNNDQESGTENREPVYNQKELSLPQKQVGSSIMPGKINPVIPEFVISAVHKIYANDNLISGLCGQGCLELNAYVPAIGVALIDSLKLLIACDQTLKKNLFEGLKVNATVSYEQLMFSPVITTALIPFIGYHKASLLAKLMKSKGISIIPANEESGMMSKEKLLQALNPGNLLKLGYSLGDIQ